jgi:TPR repeat protein
MGNAAAQYNLGRCYYYDEGVAEDTVEAAKWYRKAAEQGDDEAQHNLGVCYEYGRGVTEDKVEAVKWYRKALASEYNWLLGDETREALKRLGAE